VFPDLSALLERQREQVEVLEKAMGQIIPWVFHREGRQVRDFRGAWKGACERAGVPGRLVHDLRRTAVRNLERAGVPRSVAMKLTGHKTESVYRRYAIVSEADLSVGVQKLAALHKAAAGAPRAIVPISEGREGRTSTELAQSEGRAGGKAEQRARLSIRKRWCRRRESNPHGRKARGILSPLRIPVPPLRRSLLVGT